MIFATSLCHVIVRRLSAERCKALLGRRHAMPQAELVLWRDVKVLEGLNACVYLGPILVCQGGKGSYLPFILQMAEKLGDVTLLDSLGPLAF